MSTESEDRNHARRDKGRPSAPAAAEPENIIRPLKRRLQAKTPQSAQQEIARTAANPSPGPKSPHSRAVPDGVLERFIGIGGKYYFPDGTPAFVDRGEKLTTRSENTELVRSLISIAQARRWNSIAVSGTARFRKEAWTAAHVVGIAVKGYKPSAVEQAQLVRSLAKHRAAAREGQDPGRAAQSEENRQARRGAVYTGKLLDHGRDTYQHDPLEQSSYYVRLKTQDGERELWGVDLERAIRHSLSNVKTGDEVAVRAIRRTPVTLPARNGREPLDAHRNEWIVERTDFLAERARLGRFFRDETVTPQQAVKRHPELQGSYLKLQAVRLGAEQDYPDPKIRRQLIDRARVLIAEAIERGDPLDPVRLREEAVRRPRPRAAPELQRAR